MIPTECNTLIQFYQDQIDCAEMNRLACADPEHAECLGDLLATLIVRKLELLKEKRLADSPIKPMMDALNDMATE